MPIHYQYLFHLSSYHVFPFKCCSYVSHIQKEESDCRIKPEGVQVKSFKNVVVPQKSDRTSLILVIKSAPQNVGYRNYVARCFALVSTCCPVSMYLHSYLVHYVTAVCMIACLSIVRSKLSDLY